MKQLLRWILVSGLVLANTIAMAFIIVALYARISVGPMMGRGPSVSEVIERFGPMVMISGMIGLAALIATALYWAIGLIGIPGFRSQEEYETKMKLSLVIIPLWFFVLFFFVKIFLQG